MNQLLEKISAHYRIKEEERYENAQLLKELLNDMVKYLKKDDLFAALYTEADPAGSYWDGLKVEKPDEYDINFKFYFPKLCILTVESKCDGNVTVEVDCSRLKQQTLDQYKKFPTLLDHEGYLSWDKVNRWFERIVQNAVNFIHAKWTTYEIKQQKNGPAKTLRIYKSGEHVFDVDLVPCFFIDSRRDKYLWPNDFRLYEEELGYYLIPKPNENPTRWRPSFQKQEKIMINNKGVAKQVVRLIKVIRNNSREMHFLKSYFIKTVLLWKLKDDPAKFERKTLKDALILVLKELQLFVSNGEIPFFWEPNCNLLKKEKAITLINTSNRLNAIIKYLEQNDFSKTKAIFQFYEVQSPSFLNNENGILINYNDLLAINNPHVDEEFDVIFQYTGPNSDCTNAHADEEFEEITNSDTNTLQASNSSLTPWLVGIGVGALAAGALALFSRSNNRNN